MVRKPTPMKMSTAVQESIRSQLNTQVAQKAAPKSADPKNFPVFDIPVGKKVLIYVPNHVVEGDNGPELRMDKPLLHAIQDGKRFYYYRCLSGLTATDENGKVIFDGTCPLCDGASIPWDLANLHIVEKCKQIGLNPDDKENEQVKAIRSAEFSARVLKESNRYYTFPIVVIDTVNDDGKTIAKDESGNPIMTPMWYHISEAQYKKKWEPTFEGMEDEPTHPGGHFFTLSYIYDAKGKEMNKRDAAQNLNVIARSVKNEKLKSILDERTAEWTPEKAQEMVITNQLYSMEDLSAVAEDILAGPKTTIAFLEAKDTGAIGGSSGGFELTPPAENTAALTGGAAQMDETDADDGGDVDFDS